MTACTKPPEGFCSTPEGCECNLTDGHDGPCSRVEPVAREVVRDEGYRASWPTCALSEPRIHHFPHDGGTGVAWELASETMFLTLDEVRDIGLRLIELADAAADIYS